MSGKGAWQRPTDPATFAANWTRIFDAREAMRQANLRDAERVVLTPHATPCHYPAPDESQHPLIL